MTGREAWNEAPSAEDVERATVDPVGAHVRDILTTRISKLNAEIEQASEKVREWRAAERDASRNAQEYSDVVANARAERVEINDALNRLARASSSQGREPS